METMEKQLHILVAIDELPHPVWNKFERQMKIHHVRDGMSAYRALSTENFDMCFIDLYLTRMDSFELLRRIRAEKLCRTVILTSETPSFQYAQQGILYGVTAYLLRPLEEEELIHTISSVLMARSPDHGLLQQAAQQAAIRLRQSNVAAFFQQNGMAMMQKDDTPIDQSLRWRDFYEATVQRGYQLHPWLRLYHHPEEFLRVDYIHEQDTHMVENACLRKIEQFHTAVTELLPPNANEKMEEILLFLLQNIDKNLQQKEVAEKFYVTNSTLSTRFRSQLGISYREYMTRIKIIRARYLLRFSEVSVHEIAETLGFKDRDYFAKLFLQRTGQTLQEFVEENMGALYCI